MSGLSLRPSCHSHMRLSKYVGSLGCVVSTPIPVEQCTTLQEQRWQINLSNAPAALSRFFPNAPPSSTLSRRFPHPPACHPCFFSPNATRASRALLGAARWWVPRSRELLERHAQGGERGKMAMAAWVKPAGTRGLFSSLGCFWHLAVQPISSTTFLGLLRNDVGGCVPFLGSA